MKIRTPITKSLAFGGILASLFLPLCAAAQATLNPSEYLLVPKLPFVEKATNLSTYLQAIFDLGIGIAVTGAIVIFVYQGIHYMVSDVVGDKSKAKKGMFNAIIGLLIIFGSVLILQTINPQLTQFALTKRLEETVRAIGQGRLAPVTPTPPGGGNTAQERALRDRLDQANIKVNKGGCTSASQTDCTNLSSLPSGTIENIIALQASCVASREVSSCVLVTGGAEAGHASHGPGIPFVDVARNPDLAAYIRGNDATPTNTCLGNLYSFGGNEYLEEDNHWHVCFNTPCTFKPNCKQ